MVVLVRLTLHRLLGEEVVRHGRDGLVKILKLPNDHRKLLQDKPARVARIQRVELRHIVTKTTPDVDQHHSVGRGAEAVDKLRLDGEEVGSAPWRPALAVPAHVVVEVGAVAERLLPREHVLVHVV